MFSSTKSVKYPTPTISAVLHVGRKQGYFLWNVYLILTFITMLSFCGFAIPNDLPNFRIGTTLTLLLTSVTFKLTISGQRSKLKLQCAERKQVPTSRERPKLALYLRLKIVKGGPFGLCETPAGCKI